MYIYIHIIYTKFILNLIRKKKISIQILKAVILLMIKLLKEGNNFV